MAKISKIVNNKRKRVLYNIVIVVIIVGDQEVIFAFLVYVVFVSEIYQLMAYYLVLQNHLGNLGVY